MIKKTEIEIMQNWKGDISKPVVSICSITYNHENFIEEALDSFLMQETGFPFEIVIDDDCSPDGTANIIRKYEEKFPHIIKANLREKNIGVMKNFMSNMKRAKGKYIALCEGDDYWTDNSKLQKQVDFLEANGEYVLTYTSVEGFDENGLIKNYEGGAEKDLDKYNLQRATPINSLTACFRNVIIDFPDEMKFSKIGDLFLWALLSEYGKGKYLADILPSRYRLHLGGIYSKIPQERRSYMRFTLNSALLSYHHKNGNKEAEQYFKKLIFLSFLSSFNSTFILVESFKVLKARLFFKIYRISRISKFFKKEIV